MKVPIILLATLSLLLGSSLYPTRAETASTPLILTIGSGDSEPYLDADLWSFDADSGTLNLLTHDGHTDDGVISPDGQYIAYQSLAKEILPFFDNGGGVAGVLSTNIELLDLSTGKSAEIASQPQGYTPFKGDDRDLSEGYTHSDPVWSPDSTALAWTERGFSFGERLVEYDLKGQKSTILATYPPDDVAPAIPLWGAVGIALPIVSPHEGGFLFRVYDRGGKVLMSLPRRQFDDFPYRWLNSGDKHMLMTGSLAQGSEAPHFSEFPAGTPVEDVGKVELYNATAPDGISLREGSCERGSACQWTMWQGGHKLTEFQTTFNEPATSNESMWLAISPDGTEAAYIDNNGLVMVNGGKVQPITLPKSSRIEALNWGTLAWRTDKN
ncbi:MAG: PD40 domain-containing protein [Anaerolineae bacterium]|nr:PD40 domain-containing protein [Anaerolineae bacterium]